jgi:hypothetical protein
MPTHSTGGYWFFSPSLRVSANETGEVVKTARSLPFFFREGRSRLRRTGPTEHVSGQSSMFNQFQADGSSLADAIHEIAFIGGFLWSEVLVSAVLPFSTSLHGSEDLHGLSA